jgi:hypothetical protein
VKFKKNGVGRACGTYEEVQRCMQGLNKKLERNRPLAKPRRMWEDNFKLVEDMEWIVLTQGM